MLIINCSIFRHCKERSNPSAGGLPGKQLSVEKYFVFLRWKNRISLMFKNNAPICHVLAAVTVIVWGVTFVSTKVLLYNGLTSAEIFFYRFVLAYFCILAISHKRFFAKSIKDELLLFICGLSGGSLYFIAENTALSLTLASNVSLLICTAPLFTMILSYFVYKTVISKRMITGSAVALLGVALVVFNGNFVVEINPAGDFLTLVAAFMWAIYGIVLIKLSSRYEILFITRKVFIYGVLSLIVYFVYEPPVVRTEVLSRPVVYLNLLFLGIVASMICYIMWSYVVKQLGASKSSNYIYIIPLITIFTSVIFLNEPVTMILLLGAALITGGVYVAEK
jgi:drug/metabolite transporter (DMT)-like permease